MVESKTDKISGGVRSPWPGRCFAIVAVLITAPIYCLGTNGGSHYLRQLAAALGVTAYVGTAELLVCAAGVGLCIGAFAMTLGRCVDRRDESRPSLWLVEPAITVVALAVAALVCLRPLMAWLAWMR